MSTDRHLNLFYSYNRDNELIENNLTRAFIVTLQTIEPATSQAMLQRLVRGPLESTGFECPSFSNVQYALQGHIDRTLIVDYSGFVLAIATDHVLPGDEIAPDAATRASSIPDAWVIADSDRCCFLIESKIGGNPLDDEQLRQHAAGWLGISEGEFKERLLSISWVQVLGVVEQVLDEVRTGLIVNRQERLILSAMAEFLGYCNYRLFRGFDFSSLRSAPAATVHWPDQVLRFDLGSLAPSPAFTLAR